MKTLLSTVAVAAAIALTGCAPDKHITEVKALAFSYPRESAQDPNLTVDQALDYRKVCDSVKWKVDQTEQHQVFVQYRCDYKGVKDSVFAERDKADIVSEGDVYQWTYGTDGQPALNYAGFVIRFKGGAVKNYSNVDTTHLMEMASDNKVTNADEAFSYLVNMPIPIKPALPIADITYGNTLTSLYPGRSAGDAAILTYRWIMPDAGLSAYGVDNLGYPAMYADCSSETSCVVSGRREMYKINLADLVSHLFLVNPKDVEYAIKPNNTSDEVIHFNNIYRHKLPSPNKLACQGPLCFNAKGQLVGKAPASIMAMEVDANEIAAASTSQSSTTTDSSAAATTSTSTPSPAEAGVPASPTPSIPADDPADLAAMASLAHTAAATLAKDASDSDHGIINGPFNPSNQDLWAGKPRADGYPSYAVVCAITKDVCTQLNGMGQYLDSPIASLGSTITVVRNADVVSGKYTCGHGICTDAQFNLIGRISSTLLALHPELR